MSRLHILSQCDRMVQIAREAALFFLGMPHAIHDAYIMMKRPAIYRPYVVFAVLTVLIIAVLTGGSLLVLERLHREVAHRSAARNALDQGRLIATHLATQPIIKKEDPTSDEWADFCRQIHALAAIESGIQYVSVSHSNVVVYHEQLREETKGEPLPGLPPPPCPDTITMRPTVLQMGDSTMPVVVFSADFTTEKGHHRHVEVGIDRRTLNEQRKAADLAVSSMFKLSLLAIAIAFGACSLLLAWAGRREWRRIEQRRAEEHLAFSGVLANGIVHDFRNPMSSMRLDVQMLERAANKPTDEMDVEKVGRLATRIRTTMERLDKVFQEFLYISQPSTDERQPLDLGTCVADCIAMIDGRLEQAGVRVHTDIPHGLSVLVYEASLRRALINVLTNAEQFSERGSEISVSVREQESTVELLVSDSGPGISAEMQPQLFDMFATARPGGTGLGLFLAKAAIERSGGSIDVETTGPGGTTILIRLPRTSTRRKERRS